MSLLLSHLYDHLLPKFRLMTYRDGKGMKKENFVRQYGATLCNLARKATQFWDMNDTLKRDMIITLLKEWLHFMLKPKGKRFRNRFEWDDFHMTEWEVDMISFVVAGHARVSA